MFERNSWSELFGCQILMVLFVFGVFFGCQKIGGIEVWWSVFITALISVAVSAAALASAGSAPDDYDDAVPWVATITIITVVCDVLVYIHRKEFEFESETAFFIASITILAILGIVGLANYVVDKADENIRKKGQDSDDIVRGYLDKFLVIMSYFTEALIIFALIFHSLLPVA